MYVNLNVISESTWQKLKKRLTREKLEVNNMRDYSIEEAIEIINQCDESLLPDSKHFNIRNIQ
jgi:hypothetical protein